MDSGCSPWSDLTNRQASSVRPTVVCCQRLLNPPTGLECSSSPEVNTHVRLHLAQELTARKAEAKKLIDAWKSRQTLSVK